MNAECIWLKLVNNSSYKVTTDGKVLNLVTQKELNKDNKIKTGTISFVYQKKIYTIRKSRAIWIGFYGLIEQGKLVTTKDGSTDYSITNLELLTISQMNSRIMKKHPERHLKNSGKSQAKMTDAEVTNLRKQLRGVEVWDYKPFMEQHKIKTVNSVKLALLGKTYAHLTEPPLDKLPLQKRYRKTLQVSRPKKNYMRQPKSVKAVIVKPSVKLTITPAISDMARRFREKFGR